MSQVTLTEGHEEADPLDSRHIERQRFDLLMVKQVHIFHADAVKIILSLDLHRFRLYPVSIFPVRTVCRHLPDIDLRVKISCKRIAVVAAVAVQNVDVVDLVKLMFQRIRRKYAGYTRIKAASQQCGNARLFKFLTVCPLPFILKFCRVLRLIVRSIDIMGLRRQAGIHDRQILVRKRQVQHHIRVKFLNQGNQLIHVVCIHLRSLNLRLGGSF